jgi:hypothetical protein
LSTCFAHFQRPYLVHFDRPIESADGYPDQFGGEMEKNIGRKTFTKLLIGRHGKSMTQQKVELDYYFDNWKGNQEQIDDVLLFGVCV